MPEIKLSSNAEKKDYILNEVGIKIARENIAKLVKELLDNKEQEGFIEKMAILINDRDEINKGNIEIKKKYIGELNIE